MKRTLIVLAALVLLTPPTAVEAQQSATANVAVVRTISPDGTLRLRSAATQETRNAVILDPLSGGDLLATDATTRAAIRFSDDLSVIRMNPETQLEITIEGDRSASTKTIDIETGEFLADVNRREGSEYRIRTPTAVAAVRGTRFIVRVEPDGRTTIITLDGLLEFFTDMGTVEVPAGARGTATAADELPEVGPTSADELEAYRGLIEGDGFGAAGTPQTQQWVNVEATVTSADGRTRTILIPVPVGAIPGGGE